MSSNFVLRSSASLGREKSYKFFDPRGQLILQTRQDPFTQGINSFLQDLTLAPFTLDIKDTKGQTLFSLHRDLSTPFSPHNYRISYSQGQIQVHKGKRFQMPNLRMDLGQARLDLVGHVFSLDFYLEEGEEKIARFLGKRVDGGKEYQVQIFDDSKPVELFLASALILDDLYFDY